jgi:hypothetical protein
MRAVTSRAWNMKVGGWGIGGGSGGMVQGICWQMLKFKGGIILGFQNWTVPLGPSWTLGLALGGSRSVLFPRQNIDTQTHFIVILTISCSAVQCLGPGPPSHMLRGNSATRVSHILCCGPGPPSHMLRGNSATRVSHLLCCQ